MTPLGSTPRVKAYPIAGIFEIGMSEYDSSIIFMPLEEAQLYFNVEGRRNRIEVIDRTSPTRSTPSGRS